MEFHCGSLMIIMDPSLACAGETMANEMCKSAEDSYANVSGEEIICDNEVRYMEMKKKKGGTVWHGYLYKQTLKAY